MTTTLRPTGPLQQAADGTLSRSYEVCVNSRPVGAVDIATVPGFGRTVGMIRGLRIDDADRKRGRGTVAALAAEEVLRSWRCEQIQVSVPADAPVALRLATALGYTERRRTMAKDVRAAAPETPPGTAVRPMTQAEFAPWRMAAEEDYARTWAARGIPEEVARTKARASHEELLPDGLATEDIRLYVAERTDDPAPVGHLWVGRRALDPGGGTAAFIWDIHIAAGERGKGHGRALMRYAERVAREEFGADRIGLHVFSDNAPALRLYESLGYRATQIHLDKQLY